MARSSLVPLLRELFSSSPLGPGILSSREVAKRLGIRWTRRLRDTLDSMADEGLLYRFGGPNDWWYQKRVHPGWSDSVLPEDGHGIMEPQEEQDGM